MIVVTDLDFRITFVNRSTLEHYGYTEEELLGQSPDILCAEPEAEQILREIYGTIISGQNWSGTLLNRRKDGTTFHTSFTVTPLLDDNGATVAYTAYQQNITSRMEDKERLLDAVELSGTIIEKSPIGISVYDRAGQCIAANEAMVALVGPTREQLLQQNYNDIASWKGSGLLALAREALQEGEHKRTDLTVTTTLGKEVQVECHLVPFPRGGLMMLVNDVSERLQHEKERRSLQDQLMQSQKMEAIGQLAGGMAHDFNNMLAVIMGNANLGLAEVDEGGPGIQEFGEIMEAAERASDLTLKLLTFARKEQLNTRDIAMSQVLGELSKILARTMDKKIRIEIQLEADAVVRVDRNQLLQALINICNNAADAMPGGGRLLIQCGRTQREPGICDICGKPVDGEYCEVRLSDTGVGMSEEVLRRTPDPFFTTKGAGKGTGLGLSITQGIVMGHGGHLCLESEPDRGTQVSILLPVPVKAEQAVARKKEAEPAGGSETILVVDDEIPVLRVAGRIFERTGYTPILTSSGAEALEVYRQRGEEIDLVVLDMIMPDMGGEEVYRQLKELNPEVKVILSSGYSTDGLVGDLMQQGIQAFVQKPFTIPTMRETVRKVLDS